MGEPGVAAANALIDAGWGLRFAGDDRGATETFLRAVELAPLFPRAHLAYAEALLAQGELLPGWREFAWRKVLNEHTRKIVERIELPEWAGEQMTDGRLLVVCDEGIGDAIMFARYLPQVAERVAKVSVGWGTEHAALFNEIRGVSDVYVSAPNPRDFDAYVFICDLPAVFETTLETIPATIPYLPRDEAKVAHWKARLATQIPGDQFRVGINWSGNPSNRRDAQRSLAFAQIAPLLDVDDVNFVSLQKEVRESDRAAFTAATSVLDVSADLHTFAETAALIASLDVVVTVDSAVAHLAGALGARVLVLLPKPAEWRWLIDRVDTPWYPTMQLFRQQHRGDWAPVVKEAKRWLRHPAR